MDETISRVEQIRSNFRKRAREDVVPIPSGPHTNNHLEGWHNHLKRVTRKAHPNLFEVVEILKKEPAASEEAIEQLAGGGTIRSKRRRVVQYEDTIKKLKTEFTNGMRSLDAFVNSLSHCVVSFDY